MKYWLILSLSAVLFVSCNKQEAVPFDTLSIGKLANYNYEEKMPSANAFLDLYLKAGGDSICITNPDALYWEYKKNYAAEYRDYNSFLLNILNPENNLKYKPLYETECFILREEIKKIYHENSFNNFLMKYCELKKSNQQYVFRNFVLKDYGLIQNISYYLYLNKFQVNLDCVSGVYSISPRDEIR